MNNSPNGFLTIVFRTIYKYIFLFIYLIMAKYVEQCDKFQIKICKIFRQGFLITKIKVSVVALSI